MWHFSKAGDHVVRGLPQQFTQREEIAMSGFEIRAFAQLEMKENAEGKQGKRRDHGVKRPTAEYELEKEKKSGREGSEERKERMEKTSKSANKQTITQPKDHPQAFLFHSSYCANLALYSFIDSLIKIHLMSFFSLRHQSQTRSHCSNRCFTNQLLRIANNLTYIFKTLLHVQREDRGSIFSELFQHQHRTIPPLFIARTLQPFERSSDIKLDEISQHTRSTS